MMSSYARYALKGKKPNTLSAWEETISTSKCRSRFVNPSPTAANSGCWRGIQVSGKRAWISAFLSPAFPPGAAVQPWQSRCYQNPSSARLRTGLRSVCPIPKSGALQVGAVIHNDLDWCCTASLSQLVLVELLMETSENAYESYPQLAMGLSQ